MAVSSHVVFVGCAFLVNRDDVIHLLALFGDEGLDDFRIFIGDTDKNDTLIFIFFLKLGQMGDALAARTAPGGPKLNDVDIFPISDIDRFTLDPLGNGELFGFALILKRNIRGASAGKEAQERQAESKERRYQKFIFLHVGKVASFGEFCNLSGCIRKKRAV